MTAPGCPVCLDSGWTLDDEFGEFRVNCPNPLCKADRRCTLAIVFADGRKLDLPRVDHPSAEATLEDRYRTTSFYSAEIIGKGDPGW